MLWLGISESAVNRAFTGTEKIKPQEITTDVSAINSAVLDKDVDRNLVRHLFEAEAWNILEQVLQTKETSHTWKCGHCTTDLDDSLAIICEACLLWYHLKCCGLRRVPKKTWICRICYQAASS